MANMVVTKMSCECICEFEIQGLGANLESKGCKRGDGEARAWFAIIKGCKCGDGEVRAWLVRDY